MTANVSLVLAGLVILLLLILMVMILNLRGQVADMVAGQSRRSGPEPEQKKEASLKPMLEKIGNAVVQAHDQIGTFDVVFSDMQAQLAEIKAGLDNLKADDRQSPISERTTERSEAGPVRQRIFQAESAQAVPPVAGRAELEVTRPAFRPAAQHYDEWISADDEPATKPQPSSHEQPGKVVTSSAASTLLEEYRQLIAEPRKNEINRWVDERGGVSCMVSEDGSIHPMTREAGGLLVVLHEPNGKLMLVPGGRMVVEFATSFASPISMRSVTRDCFEFIPDGTGIMRLLEPACVELCGEVWGILSKGRISGFTS